MHIFGENWRDHARRMAQAWDARIGEEDTILLAGDLSWARDLKSAKLDLEWIGDRPGRKILLRGNHDSWWASMSKLRRELPRCCEPLQNSAVLVGVWVIFGTRGWLAPDDPLATPHDRQVFERELERLDHSIVEADRIAPASAPRLAVLHYPPIIEGQAPGPVVERLRSAGARLCVYGHLHGADHRLAVNEERFGIRFRFVAADAVDFAPVEIVGDSECAEEV